MSGRQIHGMASTLRPPGPQTPSTAKPEEGAAEGDGGMVVRALLLILGGIAIVTYVMMTVGA